jgi:hypothetical protein
VAAIAAHASGPPPNLADADRGGHVLAHEDDGGGEAARDALRAGDQVGHDAHVVAEEEAPRPPEAGLHLVEHEEGAALGAQRAQAAEVVRVGDADPPHRGDGL